MDKELVLMEKDELVTTMRPIQQAKYKHYVGRPKQEEHAKWSDVITCNICGKLYVRSNSYHHKRTNHHQLYTKVNDKMREILIKN